MVVYSIFFLLFIKSIYGREINTFYHSLNEERSDQGQWAEAKNGMPALTELTLCHWEKISNFNKGSSNIWSYCVKISEAFGGIICFQYCVEINSMQQNSSRQEYIKMNDYEERKWSHICWKVNSKGDNKFFLNG